MCWSKVHADHDSDAQGVDFDGNMVESVVEPLLVS